mgnify:CR=1 FL=1
MNTFIESNKGKHFTLSDRISIEAGIEKGWSFKKIADELGKSPSSVSREVRRHLIFSPHYYDDFFFYRAKHSHDTSLELRSSSRSGINLSLFNLYAHRNPLYISWPVLVDEEKHEYQIHPRRHYLYTVIPSVSWIFKF